VQAPGGSHKEIVDRDARLGSRLLPPPASARAGASHVVHQLVLRDLL